MYPLQKSSVRFVVAVFMGALTSWLGNAGAAFAGEDQAADPNTTALPFAAPALSAADLHKQRAMGLDAAASIKAKTGPTRTAIVLWDEIPTGAGSKVGQSAFGSSGSGTSAGLGVSVGGRR